MASDLDDLARRLGAELTARGLWRSGMRGSGQLHWRNARDGVPYTGLIVAAGGRPGVQTRRQLAKGTHEVAFFVGDVAPDLTDPATAGVLLSLLPAGWGASEAPPGTSAHRFQVRAYNANHGDCRYFNGATPGEAAARALLALWEAERG